MNESRGAIDDNSQGIVCRMVVSDTFFSDPTTVRSGVGHHLHQYNRSTNLFAGHQVFHWLFLLVFYQPGAVLRGSALT
jgi:hypothetical protein